MLKNPRPQPGRATSCSPRWSCTCSRALEHTLPLPARDSCSAPNRVAAWVDYSAVQAAFRRALDRSGLQVDRRFSLLSCRHGYASLLISEGLDVVFVARQLDHTKPTTTPSTYAHLFEKADHARAVDGADQAMLGGLSEALPTLVPVPAALHPTPPRRSGSMRVPTRLPDDGNGDG